MCLCVCVRVCVCVCVFMCVGVSTRAMFLEVQEQVHRKVMEVDFFSAWILTHDTLPGKVWSNCL